VTVRWSVVIPAFNEATRLPSYLEEVVGFFDGRGEPYEVLVVDDGSTDATVETVRATAARQPTVRVLPLGRNRGKGAAVRAGMLVATGALRMFTDAAGRVFNWLVARLGLLGIADSQCGFKAFTAAAAEALFGALQTDGFGFDVEVLLRAQAAGLRVTEVAVNWADQRGSKVGVLTASPGMLLQILRARGRVTRGRR